MKKQSCLILLFLIFISGCVILPNTDEEWTLPEINGYITDSTYGNPIYQAMVTAANGDTVFSDSNGFFHFKSKKEYVKDRLIAMDPPSPYLILLVEKNGYEFKTIETQYILIDYSRKKPDTVNLNEIKLKRNVP